MKIVINTCFGGYGFSDEAYEKFIEWGIPVRKYIEQKKGADGLYKDEPKNDGKVIFDRTLSGASFPDSDITLEQEIRSMGRYWDVNWTGERNDPLVIRVVEELGEKANGNHAKLKIVEIPDGTDWEISEYDGSEHIAEKHETWS
jgi:hypothetical protein